MPSQQRTSNSSDEGRVQEDCGYGVELKAANGKDDDRPLQKWRGLSLMDSAPNGGRWFMRRIQNSDGLYGIGILLDQLGTELGTEGGKGI